MTEPLTVHAALVEVMREVTHVGKKDRNDFHNFMFRGIDTVLDGVGPALRTHGVLVVPKLLDLASRDTKTEKDKTQREVTVEVQYTFYGPAGDTIEAVVPGEAADTGDKAVSKAMSVAFRIALLQALSIPTNEPDAASSGIERGSLDPLVEMKQKLMTVATGKGWSVDELSRAFTEWSGSNEDIRTAELERLTDYYVSLIPRTKMRRAAS